MKASIQTWHPSIFCNAVILSLLTQRILFKKICREQNFLRDVLKVPASTPREVGEEGQATPKNRLTLLMQKFDGHPPLNNPLLNLDSFQQSFPMPVWVSKEAPGSTATPEIELHVLFPGEANSAQSLNPGIAGLSVTIAYKRFCHAHRLSNFIRPLV